MDEERLISYIDSYIRLLLRKGYDESALGNGNMIGVMAIAVITGFKNAVERAAGSGKAQTIILSLPATFPESKEWAEFLFYFEYDPKPKDINLIKLRGKMGETSLDHKPRHRWDLPAAHSFFLKLLKERKKQQRPGKGFSLN